MPIPLDPPIVIPAVAAKTYDTWFYQHFHVSNLTATGGELVFSKVPMNSATGEFLPGEAKGFRVPIWEAAEAIPEAAAALQAVLAALPLIEAHFNSTTPT